MLIASRIPYMAPLFTTAIPWSVMAAAAGMCALGVIDDIIELDWMAKLAGQILITGGMALGGVQLVTFPIFGLTIGSSRLSLFATVFIVVGIINAVNFIDGLDGLAAGKGVVVAQTLAEAHAAVDQFLGDDFTGGSKDGKDTARVVVEAFLTGEEASFIVMADGRNVLALATSQDHKRLLNGDQGPNTGGMGAYSPAPVITPDIHARALREIILPTIRGMADEGTPFTGFLYAGLMIGKDGSLNTLEFNCRLGDPETQAILSRLKTPLGQLIQAGIDGRLDQVEAEWDRRSALCVVLAAAGYPAHPELGDVITGHPAHGNPEGGDLFVYHAGTAQKDHDVVTSGGRVLGVTGLGDSLKMAQTRAYEGVRSIHFNGMQYRSDIGHLGLPANQRHS